MLVPTQAVRPTAMAQGLTAKPTKPEAEDCLLLPHQIQVLQAPHPRRRTPNHDFQFSFFFFLPLSFFWNINTVWTVKDVQNYLRLGFPISLG